MKVIYKHTNASIWEFSHEQLKCESFKSIFKDGLTQNNFGNIWPFGREEIYGCISTLYQQQINSRGREKKLERDRERSYIPVGVHICTAITSILSALYIQTDKTFVKWEDQARAGPRALSEPCQILPFSARSNWFKGRYESLWCCEGHLNPSV